MSGKYIYLIAITLMKEFKLKLNSIRTKHIEVRITLIVRLIKRVETNMVSGYDVKRSN